MEPFRRARLVYMGIDPGKSGGIAVVFDDHLVPPLVQKLNAPEQQVIEFLKKYNPIQIKAVLEAVHSTPQMGVVSAFSFGKSYGFLCGALAGLGIAYEPVSPQRWQTSLQCRTGGDKNITKNLAQELFPTVKVTHAIADALLLATYARKIAHPAIVPPYRTSPLSDT